MKQTLFFCLILFQAVCIFANDQQMATHDLDYLLKTAALNADKIRYKYEDYNLAKKYSDIARATLYPRLSSYLEYSRFWKESLDQPKWVGGWGLTLSQSMTLNGKELIYYRISQQNEKYTYYELWRRTETYLFEVAHAYYSVLKSQKTIEITDANVRRLNKHQQAVADRLSVNEVAKTALFRAKAELSDAHTENKRASNANRIARASLARMVCIPNTFEIKEPEEKNFKKRSLETWIKQGLDNRAELKSINIQDQMATDQIDVAMGDYWPSLSIEGNYYDSEDNKPYDPDYNISGAVKLNYSFYDGGMRKAEVSKARIEKKRMQYLIQDITRDVSLEIETAFLELNTEISMLQALQDQLTYSQENYTAVTNQFNYGLANSVDVMDANTLLLTSEQQLAEAQYDIQMAQIKMDYVSGVFLKDLVERTQLRVEDLSK